MAEPKNSLEAWVHFGQGRLPLLIGRYLKCTKDHTGKGAGRPARLHGHEILDARIIEFAGPQWDGPAVHIDTGEYRFKVDTDKDIAESASEFMAPIGDKWTPQRAPAPPEESSLFPRGEE